VTRDEVLAAVATAIRETFNDPTAEVSEQTIAADVPGWDSLSHTILLLSIEERLKVRLDPKIEFDNVGELVDAILEGPKPADAAAKSPSSQAAEPRRKPTWDIAAHFSDISHLRLAGLNKKAFSVQVEGLHYDCYLNRRRGADRLFVLLAGAIDPKIHKLPHFARWNWAPVLGGSVLCINDPTLRLNPTLRLGWYLGDKDRDGVQGLLRIARNVAARLAIPAGRIIFYGSSGGGFAAIAAASRMRDGRAVAINPQLDITLYSATSVVRKAAAVFDKDADPPTLRRRYPLRWSARMAFRAARQVGKGTRLVIVQNEQDTHHYEEHYKPFCDELGLPYGGGVNAEGDAMSMVYSSPSGHGAEPIDVAREIIATGFPFLLRGDEDPAAAPSSSNAAESVD
jgi:acyl carrier protein